MSHSVTVPANVLQDLIANAEILSVGQHNQTTVFGQTEVLQACIDEQVGDMDTVYGREPKPTTEIDFLTGDDANVVYAAFGAR